MTDPFQPLTVRDIPRLTRYFSTRGTRLCNDSAGAAVLWQPYFQDAALELDGTLPPAARDTLHFARDTAGTLLRKAAEHVREAKRIHDELEALCRPYVDFAAADALTERTLHELFPA